MSRVAGRIKGLFSAWRERELPNDPAQRWADHRTVRCNRLFGGASPVAAPRAFLTEQQQDADPP